MTCECKPNFGQNKISTISLGTQLHPLLHQNPLTTLTLVSPGITDEHIGVYNGHLLSNLEGAPLVPSAPSKYDFPSDLLYHIGGNATCADDPSAHPGWCESAMPKCTNSGKTDFADAPIQQIAPLSSCWEPNFYFADKMAFSEIKLAAPGAWELTAYADGACTEKLGTISPEQAGTCQTFSERVKGVTSRPLFNGDPQ